MKLPLAAVASFAALAVAWAQDPAPSPAQAPEAPGAPGTPGAQGAPTTGGDQGTPPAPRGAEDEARDAKLEEDAFFRRCDQNGNGWISLREGQESLGLDASGFRSYDTDQDGRITREEFGARYRLAVARVGSFKPPTMPPPPRRAPTRNAEQLRNAYDKNGDGGLAPNEMRFLLDDYERSELPPELAVEKLDRDGSTRVDGPELEFLARLLTTNVATPPAESDAPRKPASLEELFGAPRDRSGGFQTAPMPPQIDGPVLHFRRLDLDGSGKVSADDLRKLQAPLELSVRSAAVLAALDADGDGELSPEEFRRAFGVR